MDKKTIRWEKTTDKTWAVTFSGEHSETWAKLYLAYVTQDNYVVDVTAIYRDTFAILIKERE